MTNFIDTDALELTGGAGQVAATFGLSTAAALAYLMFNLYTPRVLCGYRRDEF